MNKVHGIVSIRKNGSFGIICSQCHHLITNKGEKQITSCVFICDRCNTVNEVEEDLVLKHQNSTWKELWESNQQTYIYYDKYGNPIRKERK